MSDELTVSAPETAAAASAPAEKPAPRKRAVRRTKAAAEGEAAAPGASAEAPQAPAAPKRRGRPRKADAEAPAADASAAAASAAEGETAAAPARRKRRTKAEMAAARAAEAAGDAEAAAEKPAVKPAAKRGRKAAAEAAPEGKATAKPAAAKEQASAAEGAPAEEPVVRRRPGRPAKAIATYVPEGQTAPAASASDAPEAPADSAAPVEKPAHARKLRSRKVEGAEGEKPQGQAAERSAADQESRTDRTDRTERTDRREGRTPRQQRTVQAGPRERRANANGSYNKQGAGNRNNQNAGRNNQNNNDQRRHQRRQTHGREPMVPKTSVEELAALKVAELREKAAELGIDGSGMKKAELVEKVYEAAVRAEGFIEVEGILDIMQDGYGFLRTKGYLPSETDVYVGLATIRRNGLRKGDTVKGQTRPSRENEKYAALQQVMAVNGTPIDEMGPRCKFGDLTPVFPDDCLVMEHGKNTITARVIDLVSPIGKGQRGLIVSPPKAGKTTVLKDIAAAIAANNPEVHLMCLLVDERPEEVTDMQRSIKGEVIASTFDMPTENHIAVSELVIERAKRLVEQGKDVVVLLDSLTRLARAYNLAQPASGRILSGGVDSTALYPPKKFLGAARNIEGGGSLTILASALVETGSKMDEVIFEEFKGTGNMELKLDRALADRRVFPAIDPISSGTRKEDLLLNPQEAPLIWAVRRILSNMNSTERAMDMLIKSLKQTNNNQEFLLRTAKKAQTARDSDNFEF